MKTLLTLLTLFIMSLPSFGQVSFFDDFESYQVGDYVDQSSDDWNTWNNQPGSKSDCQITDEKSLSGEKSLKVFAADNSGPKDLLLKFKGTHRTGTFTNKMALFIPTDSRAYFNYQASQNQGLEFALHTTFQRDGSLEIKNGNNEVIFTSTYPVGEWFTYSYEVNLDLNKWQIRINDVCSGTFSNNVAKVASMNIYAVESYDNFYLDDMSFEHSQDAGQISLDAALTDLNTNAGEIIGIKQDITVVVENVGSDPISSLSFRTEKNGSESFDDFSNINLNSGAKQFFKLSDIFEVEKGTNELFVEITNVNGKADDQECNNVATYEIEGVVEPGPYKAVLVEEGTGTWCPWCVRGTVFMDRLSHRYEKYFIPVAVHNNDPMMIPEYNSFVTSWPDFSGFPGMIVGRSNAIGFGVEEDVTVPFIAEVKRWPNINITTGLEYDESTGTMDIAVFIEFLKDMDGDFHINLILTEDGVTGTGPGYDQYNAYAGGANGPMGGYELLPAVVPADQMVYDHVARAALGLQPSAANSISGSFKNGEIHTIRFSHILPSEYDPENMFLIPVINRGNRFINAREVKWNDALSRGLVNVDEEVPVHVGEVKVYPNPTSTLTTVETILKNPNDYSVSIIDLTGKQLATRTYSGNSGNNTIPLQTDGLLPGTYYILVNSPEGTSTKKLVIMD